MSICFHVFPTGPWFGFSFQRASLELLNNFFINPFVALLFEGTPPALPVKLGVSESTEIPISFITPLADVCVYEKDEARFELEISREPKNIRWLKGPQELFNDDKFELLVEGKKHTLIIKSAKYEDEAKYTFEAEDKRTSGKLFIQGKPAWPHLEKQEPPEENDHK